MALLNIFNRNARVRNYNNTQNLNNNFNTPNLNMALQSNINNGIKFTPLTEESMKKLQDEMQENIRKVNERNNSNVKELENIIDISEFLQNEQNSAIFYKELAKNLSNNNDITQIENISKECFEQVDKLSKIYLNKNNENYKIKEVCIIEVKNIKEGLILAINEELNSYDKICNLLDKNIDIDIKNELNKMTLYKLKRITRLQYLLLKYSI